VFSLFTFRKSFVSIKGSRLSNVRWAERRLLQKMTRASAYDATYNRLLYLLQNTQSYFSFIGR
ncbi:hypothetical protein, partial [uncultured Bacteroides sp.]|uniref:hypothetical protein n=1 Tax=uncultured Bacteroides sp. TaxID=162156 RepID=UPI0025A9EF15